MSNAIRKAKRYAERHKNQRSRLRRAIESSSPPQPKVSGIIVYGAGCVWWDNIENAGSIRQPRKSEPQAIAEKGDSFRPAGLPCCPHCGSVLFQHDSEKEFWAGSKKYEAEHPGYIALMKWIRGKCFKTIDAAAVAYEAETGIHYDRPQTIVHEGESQ